jgi:transcription antitermination factor NusG
MDCLLSWYAIYTKPFWEKKISGVLTKMDIESYCPVQNIERQWSDRKKIISEPLFKSYVFVRTDVKTVPIIKQVYGVVSFVSFQARPAVIRDTDIEAIRSFVSNYADITVQKLDYNVNDTVKVLNGPFMNISGSVKEVKRKTVKVLLPSLGFMLTAEFDKSNIQRASEHKLYSTSLNH